MARLRTPAKVLQLAGAYRHNPARTRRDAEGNRAQRRPSAQLNSGLMRRDHPRRCPTCEAQLVVDLDRDPVGELVAQLVHHPLREPASLARPAPLNVMQSVPGAFT